MGSEEKEMKGFKRARGIRVKLIAGLVNCDSSAELNRINSAYQENKAKGLFATDTLTAYQAAVIQKLNFEIKDLFNDKEKKFGVVTKEHEELVAEKQQVAGLTKSVLNSKAKLATDFHSNDVSSEPDLENRPVNRDREKNLTAVRKQIEELRQKVTYFDLEYKGTKDKKYRNAHSAAISLVTEAEALTNQYARNEISLSFYKSEAKDLFDVVKNKHVKELQTHRGWKEFFVNACAALIGSILFLAAALRAGTFFVIKLETDSEKKINALSSSVDKVEEDELDLNLETICKC
jgi:hypothetical protein